MKCNVTKCNVMARGVPKHSLSIAKALPKHNPSTARTLRTLQLRPKAKDIAYIYTVIEAFNADIVSREKALQLIARKFLASP